MELWLLMLSCDMVMWSNKSRPGGLGVCEPQDLVMSCERVLSACVD